MAITWASGAGMPVGSEVAGIYAAGKFVFVGFKIATSTDGETFVERTVPVVLSGALSALAHATAGFVAIATDYIIHSADGETWTQTGTTLGGFDNQPRCLASNGTTYVIINGNRVPYVSTDGATWALRFMPTGTGSNFKHLACSGSLFLATCFDGSVFTSPDGDTWTEQTALPTSSNDDLLYGGDGYFYVLRSGPELARSANGLSWATVPMGPADGRTMSRGAAGGGTVAFADDDTGVPGEASYSTADFSTFDDDVMPAGNWKSMAYGAGIFVAAASGGLNAFGPGGTLPPALPFWTGFVNTYETP
ncbi:hypothetical protein C7T35_01435 [Variovorax sp. WS11]|uniref:hypothetical protein n=1 Tax=Variovorax sp. WS11 TaxID=1105204 RepID=UPI000D0DCA61|nr:hypothetical protein [Variovorax sp. WS11]NDZ11485.1 hypothetical protein [Variovorax sp. WS11]PSL86657.1 hypothetical protein C7T35_01435 [Variovorax sp. WS11]